jgi:amino acid adenylation domain-containing protein
VKPYLLQHYLERSVSRFPEKTAMAMYGQGLTYRELWEKSGRLANQLRALGFQPGAMTGIYMPKCMEAVIAQFAVLRAGGVYIPLDATHTPPARIRSILGESGAGFLISTHTQWTALDSVRNTGEPDPVLNLRVILADNLLAGGTGRDKDPLLGNESGRVVECNHTLPAEVAAGYHAAADDLAYILYTSGSSGIPKGVMITHRNALTFIGWALECFRPRPADVFANIAPLHFDLSVFDVYVSLACGACLKLVPRDVSLHPRALFTWIKENRISFFYSVPSVWLSILNHAAPEVGGLPDLTHVLFAGEIFPPRELKTLMGLVPEAAFYNLYGPTESNVCTWHRIKNRDEIGGEPVPIGRACKGSEILVLTDDNTEASPGQEGELLVRGPGVSPGYHKNPEATQAALIRSALAGRHGGPFYRTGDIVRVTAPGTYSFVGRRDLMVKCAGFRVELEEIEQTLLKYNGIREAVAVPVYAADNTPASAIAAFVTVGRGTRFKVIELKEFLAGVLPRYMIPERIEVVADIPRNANGKADRRSLTARANSLAHKMAAGLP